VELEERARLLGASLLLTGAKAGELQALAESAAERSYAPGEFILWEGEPPRFFYLVATGKVKMLKHSPSGKEFIVGVLGPVEMLGEVAVLDGGPYPVSAQAMEETRVLCLERAQFLAFLERTPAVALKVIEVLGSRLRSAHERLRDLAAKTAEQRLASVLLMLQAKSGPLLPFTRQDIGEMAGVTTETAIRVMGRLKAGGIIGSSRGKIMVLDERKLRLLTEGPPLI
jgi:CRP/FNR family cyclic AMP-dependent transcriptional regulator